MYLMRWIVICYSCVLNPGPERPNTLPVFSQNLGSPILPVRYWCAIRFFLGA